MGKEIFRPFCPKSVSNFTEHMLAGHMNEKEVYIISSLQKTLRKGKMLELN